MLFQLRSIHGIGAQHSSSLEYSPGIPATWNTPHGESIATARGTIAIFETYNTKSPALALSCEDYGLVFRLTANDQHPKIEMNLDAELLGERPVFNTVARITGSEKPDQYVMLSAHFDSWDGSSGATDNGTGTMTMLEAMRILKQA